MERFWNIIYYFVYRANCKLTYNYFKYTGLRKLYKTPFIKRRFEKMGIKNPEGELMNIITNPDGMLGGSFVGGLMNVLLGFFLYGLYIRFIYRNNILISESLELLLVIVFFVISFLFSYILLWYKNKCKKYFKEFAKMPRKWKIKWAWISLFVILFPFVFFIWSML